MTCYGHNTSEGLLRAESYKKIIRSVIAPQWSGVPGIRLQWMVITSLMTHLKTVSYFSQSPPTQPSVSPRHNSQCCRVILAFRREKMST